jgi:hypothetical protein
MWWRSSFLLSSAVAISVALGACSSDQSMQQSAVTEPSATASPAAAIEDSPMPTASPFDEAAEVHPGLMRVRPDVAQPGDLVEARFADGLTRGVGFALERRVDNGWAFVYALTAAGGSRSTPTWAPADGTWEWEAIDLEGAGLDALVLHIPDTAEPGPYRICTTGRADNLCAAIEITANSR